MGIVSILLSLLGIRVEGVIGETYREHLKLRQSVCVCECIRPIYSGQQSAPFGIGGRTSQGHTAVTYYAYNVQLLNNSSYFPSGPGESK